MGSQVVVQTIKRIKKGEPIYENYGPLFAVTAREERRGILKERYWFECNCLACEENWPTFDSIPENLCKIKCKNKKCPDFVSLTDDSEAISLICKSCKTSCGLVNVMKAFNVSIDVPRWTVGFWKMFKSTNFLKIGTIKKL